jgi:hypothetical protein
LLRCQIECELYFNLIDFGLKKGFTLDECVRVSQIQASLIEHIQAATSSSSSTNLAACLNVFYAHLAQASAKMGEKNLNEFLAYMNEDFFRHFSLIKYVLTCERDSSIVNEVKSFHIPTRSVRKPEIGGAAAKPYDLWLEDDKISRLNESERNLQENYQAEQRKLLADEEEIAKNLMKFISNDAYGRNEPLDEKVKIEKVNKEKSLLKKKDFIFA